MKKKDIRIGATYMAKVSGNLCRVRITGESQYGGWTAVNTGTRRNIRIKSPQRLRYAVPDGFDQAFLRAVLAAEMVA